MSRRRGNRRHIGQGLGHGLGRVDALLGASAGAALGAVGVALLTQYVYDMRPCPWCVLQRLILIALALAALLGLAWRTAPGRRLGAALALALALSGAAAALWQHFVAAASASCDQTLADRIVAATGLDRLLPQVFAATASCAEARVNLAGLPYEAWSLALFVLLAGALLLAWRRSP